MSSLTKKQIYDLNNMNVAAQNVQLGSLIQSIAASSGTQTYVYTQMSPSKTWVIEHNMNKMPSVTVVDSGDSVVIGDITYNNDNKLTIVFEGAFSGKAYLN